ncbi:hypothetical protein [Nonomuraea terrae]|nr:hypothetical protein [Nonomuraea terrae]
MGITPLLDVCHGLFSRAATLGHGAMDMVAVAVEAETERLTRGEQA